MIWFDSLVDLVETVNFKLELFDPRMLELKTKTRNRKISERAGKKMKKFVCAGKKKKYPCAGKEKHKKSVRGGENSFVRFGTA